MKIRNKLLLNFTLLLVLMLLGFLFSVWTSYHKNQDRAALNNAYELSLATESVRHQIVENHLSLSNFLITGTPAELDRLHEGHGHAADLLREAQSKAGEADLRAGLNRIEAIDQEWYTTIAERFVQQHKDVESGKMKAMDLLDRYVETYPTDQLKRFNEVIDEVQTEDRALIQKTTENSEWFAHLATGIELAGFLISLGLGIFIAFRTAHDITKPLEKLIDVAREIGDKGDLDQEIDVRGTDEIGTLAQTLHNMVIYFSEMSAVSEAIAGGDLSVEVSPRSTHDTLDTAFSKMTTGLRNLVRSVRDAASQVAAGSNQVADASEDSAKINVQSASAIDEVTSTMHEMSINVQNMVKNTQMQASSVSETSASIDRDGGQHSARGRHRQGAAGHLQPLARRGQSGIGTMQKTTEGLNRINGVHRLLGHHHRQPRRARRQHRQNHRGHRRHLRADQPAGAQRRH